MKKDLEKELERVMNESLEMPAHVRTSLDQTYKMIQQKSKKKRKQMVWTRSAVAACALLMTGIILSNEQVRASIDGFFSFGDRGVEQVVSQGFTQSGESLATDQGITVKLEKSFSDPSKIGLSFSLEFEDASLLKNDIAQVTMDYRVKNGDGTYLVEFIPDTKPLKGSGGYTSGLDDRNTKLNKKDGTVQYHVVIDSNQGAFPQLQDAIIEVESINVFTEFSEAGLRKIDGKWDLPIPDQDADIKTIEYVQEEAESKLQVLSAQANLSSLNVKFSIDQVFEDETPFAWSMKLVDEKGNGYYPNGFSMESKDGRTIISTNFPVTANDSYDQVTLVVEGIAEVKLMKK
ncbi:hypothetical protein NCCP2222_23680 [Sporosarcina sp. NCCP-2222]|uniref:DUF4179 domain-containing protein n=1 Tax=Sporosarcina sp. NCCP-2222 TaxID=2935073 RepID=UPI00208A5E00|nr:DUF4179 domain-containing protein [Sporosarcina sp. NCCP-2222]GKV56421.1 hypothetical protein NCCP2222_23680 [Sporosarcina sp. NCCP-2222]